MKRYVIHEEVLLNTLKYIGQSVPSQFTYNQVQELVKRLSSCPEFTEVKPEPAAEEKNERPSPKKK